MKKRPKSARLPRRQRIELLVPPERGQPARLFRLYLRAGLYVEVRIARDRRRMMEEITRLGWAWPPADAVAAVHWRYRRVRRAGQRVIAAPGRQLGTVFFNLRDLRHQGANTVAHESTHLAMLVMRWRRHDILADEEPLANLVGEFTQAINDILYACGVWGRRSGCIPEIP